MENRFGYGPQVNRFFQIARGLRWDIVLVGLLVLGWLLYGLNADPIYIGPSETSLNGSRPPDRTEGDVLLLLPSSPAAAAIRVDELDASYGWYNTLWQELGSFATAISENLSPELLTGRTTVIIPRSVAQSLPANGISALEEFVKDGGNVLVEQPPNAWTTLTNVTQLGQPSDSPALTKWDEETVDFPIVGQLLSIGDVSSDAVVAWAGSRPAIVRHAVGSGSVYTFLFRFGLTIQAIQQGVGNGDVFETGVWDESANRSARESRRDRPVVDDLERRVFSLMSDRPLPNFWYFPDSHHGVVVIGFSAERYPDSVNHFVDGASGPVSVFVAPDDLRPANFERLSSGGVPVGATIYPSEILVHGVSNWGVGIYQPLAFGLSMRDQVELLESKTGKSVFISKVAFSQFNQHWSQTFAELANTGVVVDVSFSPHSESRFPFGTTMPFYPIDARGLPIPMLEWPATFNNDLTDSALTELLAKSMLGEHRAINIVPSATKMFQSPSSDFLTTLYGIENAANENEHWITTHESYIKFLSARRQSVMTSQWREPRLTVTTVLAGARIGDEVVPPVLSIPEQFNGRAIEAIEIDGVPTPDTFYRLETLKRALIPLTEGNHTVSIRYEPLSIPDVVNDEVPP